MGDAWLLLNDQHEVLDQDFCSGYVDAFGKWNTGFVCPLTNRGEQLYCCGTPTWRYCCKGQVGVTLHTNFNAPVTAQEDPLLLMLGIALGTAAGLALLLLISCCLCPGCLLHRKRRTAGPPVYRLQRSSTLPERSISVGGGLNPNGSAWGLSNLAPQQPITPLPLARRGTSSNNGGNVSTPRDHQFFGLDNELSGGANRTVQVENLEERLASGMTENNLPLPVSNGLGINSQATLVPLPRSLRESSLPPSYPTTTTTTLRACPSPNRPPQSNYQRSIPWQPTGLPCSQYALREGSEPPNLLVSSVDCSESAVAVPLRHVHRIDCMYHSSSKY